MRFTKKKQWNNTQKLLAECLTTEWNLREKGFLYVNKKH